MSAWNLKERHTIGEYIRRVLEIDNEEDAKEFFSSNLKWVQRQIDMGDWKSKATPIEAVRSNIGWCFGEGMEPERIAMWRKICRAEHPMGIIP